MLRQISEEQLLPFSCWETETFFSSIECGNLVKFLGVSLTCGAPTLMSLGPPRVFNSQSCSRCLSITAQVFLLFPGGHRGVYIRVSAPVNHSFPHSSARLFRAGGSS